MSREELEKRILEARYNLVSTKDKETIDILEELAIEALEQESILDKIRAEIEQTPTVIWEENKNSYILASYFKKQVLKIIDKYRKEN